MIKILISIFIILISIGLLFYIWEKNFKIDIIGSLNKYLPLKIKEGEISKTIYTYKPYSSNQTITNSLSGNNSLNLDNVGTLTFLPGAPIGSSTTEIFHSDGDSVAVAFNIISRELPPDENNAKHFTTGKFKLNQIYFFDTEENHSHLIKVFDRKFRVTLQKIKLINKNKINASTTLEAFKYEYQFGIFETRE